MVLGALLGYLLAMLLIGALSARRAAGAAGFLVAERRGSAGLVAGSLVATMLGASTTLGMAERGYSDGLVGAWWLLAGLTGLLLLVGGLAQRIRRYGVVTLPELLEAQYGPGLRRPAGLVVVVAWVGIIAAQLAAAGHLLSHFGGGSAALWSGLAAVVVVAYTALGGQLSILRTDAAQAVILLVGLAVCLGFALAKAGGWAATAALPPELTRFPFNAAMGPAKVLDWLVMVGLTYAVGPDIASRLLCAVDERAARRAAVMTAMVLVPVAFAVTAIGVLGRVLAPGVVPGQALPAVIDVCLPPWATSLVVTALLAALMSSADTCLLTAATILTVDLCGAPRDEPAPGTVRASRLAVGIVGAAGWLVALRLERIIPSLLLAYTVYTCGVAVPVLFGFARERLRLTVRGARAAMLGGGGLALLGKLGLLDHLLGQVAAEPPKIDWSLLALLLGAALLLGLRAADGVAEPPTE